MANRISDLETVELAAPEGVRTRTLHQAVTTGLVHLRRLIERLEEIEVRTPPDLRSEG
jgi:hypothetical protein